MLSSFVATAIFLASVSPTIAAPHVRRMLRSEVAEGLSKMRVSYLTNIRDLEMGPLYSLDETFSMPGVISPHAELAPRRAVHAETVSELHPESGPTIDEDNTSHHGPESDFDGDAGRASPSGANTDTELESEDESEISSHVSLPKPPGRIGGPPLFVPPPRSPVLDASGTMDAQMLDEADGSHSAERGTKRGRQDEPVAPLVPQSLSSGPDRLSKMRSQDARLHTQKEGKDEAVITLPRLRGRPPKARKVDTVDPSTPRRGRPREVQPPQTESATAHVAPPVSPDAPAPPLVHEVSGPLPALDIPAAAPAPAIVAPGPREWTFANVPLAWRPSLKDKYEAFWASRKLNLDQAGKPL